ncbi:methyltransferase family protein [Sandaracinobacteroides hominis]|uniref:methyltransferase family protein n=1 Tax=Sandaracinobacteroides hominis TaxID=2780086 RepID=UPI000DB25FDB|nr:isoprenylcysteine carboxylmethyltransferase family protein [Sandaracinobacteroides hominis]PZU44472.1 MAG: isoprenylcysteine carboxyl methyltransferase [Sphingomonas sp.]
MTTTAGMIAPPPLIYLAGAAAGLLADWLLQLDPLPLPGIVRWTLFAVLAVAGAAVIAAALGRFGQAKTPPEPWKPTTALATDGIYARTRNPMYLGMALLLIAVAVGFASLGTLLMTPLVILVVDRFVIAREERYLTGLFSAPYSDYRRQVRRWL